MVRADRLQEVVDGTLAGRPLVSIAHGPAVYVHAWHVSGFDPERTALPRFADLDLRV